MERWTLGPYNVFRRGHMVMGEPINVSEVTWVVRDMEHWTRALENVFWRSHGVV